MTNKAPAVYAAISDLTKDLALHGIQKDAVNQGQKFKYRGIDQVYAALSTRLPKFSLVMIPRVLNRTVAERISRNGGANFYVTVEVEYDLVSTQDGSIHVAKSYGEAMDSGDKATAKAMSAAYKYLCLELFCIPVEGQEDADAHNHDIEIDFETMIYSCKSASALTNLFKTLSTADQTQWKPVFTERKEFLARRVA